MIQDTLQVLNGGDIQRTLIEPFPWKYLIDAGQVVLMLYITNTVRNSHKIINSAATALAKGNEQILAEAHKETDRVRADNKLLSERLIAVALITPAPNFGVASPSPVTVVNPVSDPIPVVSAKK